MSEYETNTKVKNESSKTKIKLNSQDLSALSGCFKDLDVHLLNLMEKILLQSGIDEASEE